jgi:hypothetical protein
VASKDQVAGAVKFSGGFIIIAASVVGGMLLLSVDQVNDWIVEQLRHVQTDRTAQIGVVAVTLALASYLVLPKSWAANRWFVALVVGVLVTAALYRAEPGGSLASAATGLAASTASHLAGFVHGFRNHQW